MIDPNLVPRGEDPQTTDEQPVDPSPAQPGALNPPFVHHPSVHASTTKKNPIVPTAFVIDSAKRSSRPVFPSELTQTTEGTGLGLAISRDLATLMDRALTVGSAVGVAAPSRCAYPAHANRPS